MTLSRANPLARKLSYAWYQPPGGARDGRRLQEHVRKAHGAFSGTQRWKSVASYPHIGQISTDSPTIDCGNLDFAGVTRMTIFAVGHVFSTAGWWSVGRCATSGHRIGVYGYAGDMFVSFENGASSAPAVSGGFPTRRFSVAATYDGNETGWARVAMWINGKPRTLATAGSSPPASLATRAEPWELGRHGAYSGYTTGSFERCYIWIGRVLSGTAIKRLHEDPDRIFGDPAPDPFAAESAAAAAIFRHHYQQQGMA